MYHVLYACENIFLLSDSNEWIEAITQYMTPHIDYLRKVASSDLTLDPAFRKFLQKLIRKYREPAMAPPPTNTNRA
jgi:hypothetical protein